MENNNDKSKTVEFRPVKENKQQVNRRKMMFIALQEKVRFMRKQRKLKISR